MTRLKLLALLPLAISSVAFGADAASTGSEYLHMTSAGKWEVSPMINYQDYTIKYTNPTNAGLDKAEVTGVVYGVKGEYGINEMFSVGINLAMENDSIKSSAGSVSNTGTASGLNNIDLYGNGKNDLFGGTFRYGLDFSISPGSTKQDLSSGAFQGSYGTSTGGVDAIPFVAWEMAMGPGILGAKFSYSFQLTDRKYNSTPSGNANLADSEKGDSAQSLTAFYEWMMNNWSLGLAVSYNGVSGSKLTMGNGSSVTADNGHAGIFAEVYAPIVLADNITLIPNAGFGDNGEILIAEQGNVKSYNGWNLSVAARFGF
jgi:hypothetical protein